MANWAYVENDTVIEVFDNLPKNWRNISNLDASESDLVFLKSLGWHQVNHNSVSYEPNMQTLQSLGVTYDGSDVFETVTVIDIPPDVLYDNFMTALRTERDIRLKDSDFLCLNDLLDIKGIAWKQAVYEYRQALRNLPEMYPKSSTVYYMFMIQWPVKPNINDYPNV